MRYLITAIYLAMLLGCTSKYSVPELPSPSLVPAFYQQTVNDQYSIQVGDQLEIKSYFQPQLNQNVVVRPDGRITLVLIGEFIAANKSQTELIEELKSQYGKYMEVAGINVSVVAVAPFKVYFGGEVAKPTVQQINQSLTLLQGITQSGGFKTTANIT